MRVQSLRKEIAGQAEAPAQRTGIFTTNIIAPVDQRRVALFFTGRKHAGENLDQVLRRRAAGFPSGAETAGHGPAAPMDEGATRTKKVQPTSGLRQAIRFKLNHWEPLPLFLRVAGAPLSNNIREGALKMAILHRKNSLGYKTENGAAWATSS